LASAKGRNAYGVFGTRSIAETIWLLRKRKLLSIFYAPEQKKEVFAKPVECSTHVYVLHPTLPKFNSELAEALFGFGKRCSVISPETWPAILS
jgi:hypothetical protein